ncbi:hypothetical protein WOLCODRAFT_136298 [Wolfiporia cocos MD-104 SS10]|uniref:Prokaryotic-type class I peptide chain release factors domain-containing protein n=1 Tax=Wolfiporia cocos (strain MD-104) TaxID=742152 RepID=A0A2H3JI89_WOLCO|nr:hypothetical protein WOLCODRAFT_136298 [Wolfiporia cocos MD-104 SS10]
MSLSPSLLASARSAYRGLLRATATTFAGDTPIRNAFRVKIRSEVLTYPSSSDPKQFEEKIKLTREIADVLRKNVVQGVRIEEAQGPGTHDRFQLRITEHTELGSNDTIKNPPPVESSRSARKHAAKNNESDSTPEPQLPRFYSQLKKAAKQHVVPELREEDLEESFVRGSGPGGQSINKTENNVQLLHKPTGLRVACQETRSLAQNRKIARKILRNKLDAMYNPGLSKQEVRKALEQERERRRRRKAKKAKKLQLVDQIVQEAKSRLAE